MADERARDGGSWPIRFACPRCRRAVAVGSIQGERCPGCESEFKYFAAGEERTAQDYFAVLTGAKYLIEIPDELGWIVAHE